jgi:hypothetical protein
VIHADSLVLNVRVSCDVCGPGDSLDVELRLVNRSQEVAVLEFTSGQRYDLLVVNGSGDTVWRWSDGRGFIQALGQERVAAGDALLYAERVPAPVEPGQYVVVGLLTASNAPLRAETTVRIR